MKIAVSACLLGRACRYDGASKPCADVIALAKRHELVPVCPELAGGMSIPHAPCEIASHNPLKVRDSTGADKSEAYTRGAKAVRDTILSENCNAAVLKAKSPSCGIGRIYDGTFTGTLIPGNGVAARLILEAKIPAFDERHIPQQW